MDTMASFTCNDGYFLSESDSSVCQDSGGGTWNLQTPTCQPSKSATKANI